MNQKNGFAAMAGCRLGHPPKCMNQGSLPIAASSPASQLAYRAAQCSGTFILSLNLSHPSLHQSRKKATLIFNSTSFPLLSQACTGFPLGCATGGFPQCLWIRAASLTGSGSFAVAGGLGGATLWEEGVEL